MFSLVGPKYSAASSGNNETGTVPRDIYTKIHPHIVTKDRAVPFMLQSDYAWRAQAAIYSNLQSSSLKMKSRRKNIFFTFISVFGFRRATNFGFTIENSRTSIVNIRF